MNQTELLNQYNNLYNETLPKRRNARIIVVLISISLIVLLAIFLKPSLVIGLSFPIIVIAIISFFVIDSALTIRQHEVYKEYMKVVIEDLRENHQFYTDFVSENPITKKDLSYIFKDISDPLFFDSIYSSISIKKTNIAHSLVTVRDNSTDMPKTIFDGSILKIDDINLKDFWYESKEIKSTPNNEYEFDINEYDYSEFSEQEEDTLEEHVVTLIKNLKPIIGPNFICCKKNQYLLIAIPKRLDLAYEYMYTSNTSSTPQKRIEGGIEKYIKTMEFYKKIKDTVTDITQK